ncbi:hypothetical protein HID58_072355, partial [Brassica napus]
MYVEIDSESLMLDGINTTDRGFCGTSFLCIQQERKQILYYPRCRSKAVQCTQNEGGQCEFGVDVIVAPPLTNWEVLSFTEKYSDPKFSWTIKKISELKEDVTSRTFSMGGKKWVLKLYPKGDPTADGKWLSVFLYLADCDKPKADEKIFVQANMRVLGPLGSNHFKLQMETWYTEQTPAWGWSRFLSLAELGKVHLDKEDMLKVEIEFKNLNYIPFYYHDYVATRLIIYPQGNGKDNGSGYISMYVEIESESLMVLTPPTEVFAEIRFFVYNKKENKYLTIQDIEVKRFNALKTLIVINQKHEKIFVQANFRSTTGTTKKPWVGAGFSFCLYLNSESKSLTPPNEISVELRFFVYNKKKNKYFTIQDVEVKRFNALKTVWGLGRVLLYDTFNNPGNGYIFEGDQCEFGVHVIVSPPPTRMEILSFDDKIPYPKYWTVKKFSELIEYVHMRRFSCKDMCDFLTHLDLITGHGNCTTGTLNQTTVGVGITELGKVYYKEDVLKVDIEFKFVIPSITTSIIFQAVLHNS